MIRAPATAAAAVVLSLVPASAAWAQAPPPPGASADTVRVRRPVVTPTPYPRSLDAGERLIVRVEGAVRVTNPGAGGRPVPDAPPGAVVARFAGSAPFAWPREPTVWTAPGPGRLVFGLNVRSAHEPRGSARVIVTPLTDAVRRSHPAPAIAMERSGGSLTVRYRDRSGFGLDRRSLALHLETSRGTRYRLAAWAAPGERRTVLPLPPPVPLPPGVHEIRAEITDRLGNVTRSGPLLFATR
ncbi:MAG: hypothetical protein R3199_06775 [Gemmatimonadota bacterium]|nr:hypothetical protein [Gemmatimonadota bacterium]